MKIAPDLTDDQVKHIVLTARNHGADGMVVCNTTVSRPKDATTRDRIMFDQTGGMSGRPLNQRSTELIRLVRSVAGPDWPIIGVGGVSSGADAWEKIAAGATLIQAYSGFVFEGPALVKSVVHGLNKRLEASRHEELAKVIGSGTVSEEGC